MKVLVVFYSLYGHVYTMAQEAAKGIEDAGLEAVLKRVPETLSDDILKMMGALDFQKNTMAKIPVATPDDLAMADGILFGTPTRFGNMCGQMKQFLDATGQLWAQGKLVGKPAGVFTSTATQHGGQESTILSFHFLLLHHGMVITGLPYSFQDQTGVEEVKGGSPYGASTIADGNGSRMPSAKDLAGARYQGKYLAEITKKLKG